MTLKNTTTRVLVQDARHFLGMTQAEFGRYLKKNQALISRYESGTVIPPGDVVMRCMHILDNTTTEISHEQAELSSSELAQAVEECLAGPDKQKIRQALNQLILCLKS